MDIENNEKYQLLGPSDNQGTKNLLKDYDSNTEKATQRLQALLSEWLRMENLVILTGSGCSINCGGKTMSELEKVVLDTVQNNEDMSKEALEIIKERLKDGNGKKEWAKTGFEQWLSYLVNSVYLVQETSSPVESLIWEDADCKIQDISKLINYISKAIYAECALILPDDKVSSNDKQEIAPHLAFFIKIDGP